MSSSGSSILSYEWDNMSNEMTFCLENYEDKQGRMWSKYASFNGETMELWWESNDGIMTGSDCDSLAEPNKYSVYIHEEFEHVTSPDEPGL